MRDPRFAVARHRADGFRFRAEFREGQQPRRDRGVRIAGLQHEEVSDADGRGRGLRPPGQLPPRVMRGQQATKKPA
ncbi:hypothetical protein BCEN4_1190008 [Burkholderia cenocepacia]|nr:hypothetical protein BCEN4_1190008 [Burkholderia cenocepacia]